MLPDPTMASTAVVRGSGTGDTNRGNLLSNLLANKSILGRCFSGRRNHSAWMVWPSLDSLSPGLECVVQPAWNVSGFFMYDTTMVLSVATSTILFEQRSWNSFKARKTAFSSR